MKKYLNNKLYDTSTATLVGVHSNQMPASDFSWMRESLYRKRTGEYFLFGEGCPSTRYGKVCGNNEYGYGESIMPLTFEAAQKWAEKNLEADDYESEFHPSDEEGGNATSTFSLPASVTGKIRAEAARRSISLSAVISDLVEKNL